MLSANDWGVALRASISAFQRATQTEVTQVRVHLEGSDPLHVLDFSPIRGADLLAFSPYPKDTNSLRVGPATGMPVSPELVLVEPRRITRVELRVPLEKEQALGFHPPEESELQWPPEE